MFNAVGIHLCQRKLDKKILEFQHVFRDMFSVWFG